MQSIDWDSLKQAAENAGGGEPVPASDYLITVQAAEAKAASNGKPMIKLRGRINGGPHDKRAVFTQMVISPESDAALAIYFRQMKAYGLDQAYFAEHPSLEQVAAALVGRQVIWTVGVKMYQDAPKNEVTFVKSAAGAVPAPPTAAAAATPTPIGAAPPAPAAPAAPAPTPPPVPPAQSAPVPDSVPVPVSEPIPVPSGAAPAPPAPPF